MEMALLICLIIFISLMISGKPVKIEITHAVKQDTKIPEKAVDEVSQKDLDNDDVPLGMDGVVSAFQSILGVDMNEE